MPGQENNDLLKKLTILKKYISDFIKITDIEYKKQLEENHRYQACMVTSGQINDLLSDLEIEIIKLQYKKE